MRNLVLVHGWGTHPVIWEPLLSHLGSAWNIFNLALPGYAGTRPVEHYSLQGLAAELSRQIPDESILVGWSLGGLVAMEVARYWRNKLSRLILIGTTPCFVTRPDWPHGVAGEVFDGFASNLSLDYEGTLRRFLALQAQGSGAMRDVLRVIRNRLLAMPRVSDEVLRGGLNILRHADLRRALPEIPVTLIHGGGDKLAPIGAARWLANELQQAALIEIADAGHAPFLSHGAQVADCLEALLNA